MAYKSDIEKANKLRFQKDLGKRTAEQAFDDLREWFGEETVDDTLAGFEIYSRLNAFNRIVETYVDNDPYDEVKALQFAETIKQFEATKTSYVGFDANDNVLEVEADKSLVNDTIDVILHGDEEY